MTVIIEGKLQFTFGSAWHHVLKYDENGSFYRSQLASKLESTKAVDFLCLNRDSNQPIVMLEVKDFSSGVPKHEKFDQVHLNVALKIRDTIAGIIGGSYQASDSNERSFFRDSYQRMSNPPRVFYLFEDLITPTRQNPGRIANSRDVVLKKLQEHLRWLTPARNIMVIGLDDYRKFINDLSIQRLQV